MSELTLSREAAELIETLTQKLRVLTPQQIARTWFASGAEADELLDHLGEHRLVERRTMMAHPEIELAGPEFLWQPGGEEPNLGAVAYRLRRRWTLPPGETELVRASGRARRMFGGPLGGRWPRVSETTHDVHLAKVYLIVRERDPERARSWRTEDGVSLKRATRGRVPDAVVGGADGTIVEFGGAYSKAKLVRFHDEFADRRYEIW